MGNNCVYVMYGKCKGEFMYLDFDNASGGYPYWRNWVSTHTQSKNLEAELKSLLNDNTLKGNYIKKTTKNEGIEIESIKIFKVDFAKTEFIDITKIILDKEKIRKKSLDKLTSEEKAALGLE